jgi:hypothetical protein
MLRNMKITTRLDLTANDTETLFNLLSKRLMELQCRLTCFRPQARDQVLLKLTNHENRLYEATVREETALKRIIDSIKEGGACD